MSSPTVSDADRTGKYFVGVVLLALFGWVVWLIASYPTDPTQRVISDRCEAIANPPTKTGQDKPGPDTNLAVDRLAKANDPHAATQETNETINTDREIAKYTCQLAAFTKWLFIATGVLAAIGVIQAIVLYRSVNIADRAATEAKGAIRAAQTSADAAQSQARIMAAAESPIFAFGGFKMAHYAQAGDPDPLVDPVQGGIPIGLHQPLVLVRNLGRSPMQLRMFCVESFVGRIVPATQRYQNISTIGQVIRRDENIWVKNYSFYIALSPDDISKVQNNNGFRWVYGVIRYYNQFTNELIDKGFLLKWNHSQNGGFGWAGLHNYAYDHRQKSRPEYDLPFP